MGTQHLCGDVFKATQSLSSTGVRHDEKNGQERILACLQAN